MSRAALAVGCARDGRQLRTRRLPNPPLFTDRWLLARAGLALTLANARFWSTVAPLAAREIRRWERRARAIEDPALRTIALKKLAEERFNSEVAATLATLAPAAHRTAVTRGIVAYEVMYDFLDGLTEQPTVEPLRMGRERYRAFIEAVSARPYAQSSNGKGSERELAGNGYLSELANTVNDALATLPRAGAVTSVAARAAARCAEAQIRAHAAPQLGSEQLERWALREARDISLGWREFLAGAASSVLAVHALIAAAADERTTPTDAARIDATYLSMCALSTMLDSLIDHDRDTQAGETGYLRYYTDHGQLARDLTRAVRHAFESARALPNGAHHAMTLTGVVAYYISAPTATTALAKPVTRRARRELEPLITPTLAVMRCWRAAKRARRLARDRRERR
jgi:tetraprenyl-beta-curcumene synthase